jgi:hypothetical protein
VWTPRRWSTQRPLPLSGRRPDRMTPMLAAAGPCSSRVAAAEIKEVERHPARRAAPTRSKQPGTATPDDTPQPARIRNDPMSFVLCPYNDRASAAALHNPTKRRRLQAPVRRPKYPSARRWRSRGGSPAARRFLRNPPEIDLGHRSLSTSAPFRQGQDMPVTRSHTPPSDYQRAPTSAQAPWRCSSGGVPGVPSRPLNRRPISQE